MNGEGNVKVCMYSDDGRERIGTVCKAWIVDLKKICLFLNPTVVVV